MAAYDLSANVFFLKGADFGTNPPSSTEESSYVKLGSIEELNNERLAHYIIQAGTENG